MYFMIGKHFKHCNLQNLKFLTFSIAAILKNLQEAWRPFRTADTKVNVLSKKPLLCTLQYTYLMIHNITFSEGLKLLKTTTGLSKLLKHPQSSHSLEA